MKRFAYVLAICALLLPGVCFAGPFGFNYGMTREQAIALVGKDAILTNEGFLLRVDAVPKPDPAFETYDLIFSPDKGLLKIKAIGKTITSGAYGIELQVGFRTERDALSAQYGHPTHEIDTLQPDSTLNAPNDWMAALLKKDRKLAAAWDVDPASPKSQHLDGILLEAKGLRNNDGWVELSYEFAGYADFVNNLQKQYDAGAKK